MSDELTVAVVQLCSRQDVEENLRRCGELVGIKTHRKGFGRIAAQTAKQVIIQRVREAERDFARFLGWTVRVQMREPHEGRKNFVGKLLSAGEGSVGVEVDGKVFRLPLDGMKKAHLEVEL